MTQRDTAISIFVLIVVGVVARLLPHVPNFAPITATALFCGAYMDRRISIGAPVVVLLLSDYLLLYVNPYGHIDLSTVHGLGAVWHSTMPFVYASFAISSLAGWLLRTDRSPLNLTATALFCSLQFFLITNAAVWIVGAYDRGLNGLWQSYAAGLPFFKGTLMGDLLYTFTFFGLYEMVRNGRRSALPLSAVTDPM